MIYVEWQYNGITVQSYGFLIEDTATDFTINTHVLETIPSNNIVYDAYTVTIDKNNVNMFIIYNPICLFLPIVENTNIEIAP